MIYSSLDKIIRGYLLQRRYPIHFYIDFLIYAVRCFEEIHHDSIGNVRSQKLRINRYGAVTLPVDFMDWVKVSVEAGQFLKPLINRPGINRLNNYTVDRAIATFGTIVPGSAYTNDTYTNVALTSTTSLGTGATANITVAGGLVTVVAIVAGGEGYTVGDVLSVDADDIGGTGSGFSVSVATITSSGKILFPELPTQFITDTGSVWYNDRLEFTGRRFGASVNRTDSFSVVPERNEIQLHNNIDANDIVLQYISDGSEVDNATQITPYATATIEAFINWKLKENARSYSEGERARAQRQFEHQHRILRARTNPITMNDIRAIINKNTKGSPK